MMRRDPFLVGFVALAAIAGLFALASASLGLLDRGGEPFTLVARQLVFGWGIGIAVLWLCDRISLSWLEHHSFWIFGAVLLSALAVFIPAIGFESGGATRWIHWGPIFLQPSEFLKIGFVLYSAAWLASRHAVVRSFEFGMLPFVGILSVLAVVLVAEPDIGTLGVVISTGILLFFIGGGRMRHLGALAAGFLIFAALVIWWKPYALERMMVFFDPLHDPQGAGYQVRQAAIALGSGGIWGKGFGQSSQKFHYLPEPTGDAIFAVIGEEFGFAGAVGLIFLFLFLLWRVVFIVRRTRDLFSRLLGLGIGIMITIQAFVHMGALAGLVPLTGITLPFLSHGGSSLVSTFAAVGLLLNISKFRK